MKFLLDSVICIDHFNGIDAATDFIYTKKESIPISVVTRAGGPCRFSKGYSRRCFGAARPLAAFAHSTGKREPRRVTAPAIRLEIARRLSSGIGPAT